MEVDPPSPAAPSPASAVEEDPVKLAEKVKEDGNTAFKAQRFQEAIELYTRAIGQFSSTYIYNPWTPHTGRVLKVLSHTRYAAN